MDVARFNKILKDKIATAKRLENHGELQDAIKRWLEISELALQASKRSDIEFKFKAMLIKKTEQIIDHVKDLKLKATAASMPIPEEEISIGSKETPLIEEIDELSASEKEVKQEMEVNHDFLDSNQPSIKKEAQTKNEHPSVQMEGSESKKIPNGFKEIEAPKEFKIVTPHDAAYIEKLIKKSDETELLKPQKTEKKGTTSSEPTAEEVKIELDVKTETGEVICFACGHGNPPGSKTCKNCGTELN